MITLDARGKRVLFISDTHIPYSVDGYLEFLKDLKEKFKPEIVIHGGDEIDGHAISFHKSISELFSAGHELDKSIIEIQEGLHVLFPKLYLLESNHGSLIFRRLKAEGIPIRHLKPLHELYETPLWEWHDKIILRTKKGKVAVSHGMSGIAGAWAKLAGMSTVEFHFHSMHQITRMKTLGKETFSMHCSCLADQEKLAFTYAKANMKEFLNGTGGIYADGEPVLFPYSKAKYG